MAWNVGGTHGDRYLEVFHTASSPRRERDCHDTEVEALAASDQRTGHERSPLCSGVSSFYTTVQIQRARRVSLPRPLTSDYSQRCMLMKIEQELRHAARYSGRDLEGLNCACCQTRIHWSQPPDRFFPSQGEVDFAIIYCIFVIVYGNLALSWQWQCRYITLRSRF